MPRSTSPLTWRATWTALWSRRQRLGFTFGDDPGGRFLTHAHAIRKADSVVPVAGQIEAGKCSHEFFDSLDALRVAHRVLRHGMRPPSDVVKYRLGFESHDVVQIGAGGLHQLL